MSSNADRDLSKLVALVAEMVREKEETRRLLNELGRGSVTADALVKHIASEYQTEIGGAVRGLAAHDKAAAQRLGEQLRDHIDVFLAELGSGPRPSAKPAVRKKADRFKDKTDAVLIREYVLVKALTVSDQPLQSGEIYDLVRAADGGLKYDAMTANLARLANAEVIGKERKGRFHGVAQSHAYLKDLKAEIEARGLSPPA